MSQHHRNVAHLWRGKWNRVRRQVFERDGWRCVLCGKAGRLECDHIRPMHKGGAPLDPDNLQTLCRDCHIEKTRAENSRPPPPGQAEWQAMVAEMVNGK